MKFMYQVPVTETYAICSQVMMGSTPDGVAGEEIPAGGEGRPGDIWN